MNPFSQQLMDLALGIKDFLVEKVKDRGSFPGRTYYGETFALALFSLCGVEGRVPYDSLLSYYSQLDRSSPEFHWEFNNYALLTYGSLTGDSRVKNLVFPLKMKGTACTNWTLLRFVGECLAAGERKRLSREACRLLDRMQLPSGLILDERQTKSFQYHCFSAAMIFELYQLTGDVSLRERFLLATLFVRRFILDNGETLYVGRGQNQSFGYGALAYILVCAYALTNDATLLGQLNRVLRYLRSYQRADGAFPLVMGGCEHSIPEVVDPKDPEFCGWYPYNNYYDYLPFLGFFLAKAATVLGVNGVRGTLEYRCGDYCDPDYRIVCRDKYTAVLARPGGNWTNGMPMPYILSSECLMPCYGGEQFQASLYDETMLGLPYFPGINRSISWRALSWFFGDSLWVISPLGIMRRHFRFLENRVDIRTRVIAVLPFRHVYAFLDGTFQRNNTVLNNPAGLKIESTKPFKYIGVGHSASGGLKLFSTKGFVSSIRLEIIK